MDSDDAIRVTKFEVSKWDVRFLRLAREISSWSKDPSTKVGAVIVDSKRNVVATGYNGFPAGTPDDDQAYADRDIKYSRIIHAEMNAILRAPRDLSNHTIYTWPFMSCDRCCPHLIQAGIRRCVAPMPSPSILQRWSPSLKKSADLFRIAGVEVEIVPAETVDQ